MATFTLEKTSNNTGMVQIPDPAKSSKAHSSNTDSNRENTAMNKEAPMVASTSKTYDKANPAVEARPKGGSEKWAVNRIVRRGASPPAAIYNWLAGPPLTGLERSRARLADVRNSQGRSPLVV